MLRLWVANTVILISLGSCLPLNREPVSTPPVESSLFESAEISAEQRGEVLDYFKEVAFGSEFGELIEGIARWETDVKIFVSGQYPTYLDTELAKIIDEINSLSRSIQLSRTLSRQEANYLIHFGTAEEYAEIEPQARPYIEENWGLLWVYWNAENEIYQGSMYVDMERTQDDRAVQKHLLREELTQSLGLINDSYTYPESIFYQDWTRTTEYAEIDKRLIDILYSDAIEPRMTKQEVEAVFTAK